jgi:hypothetical protein
MASNFFPERPKSTPTIYAYELTGVPSRSGQLKVGYTCRNVQDRVAEQLKTSQIGYKIVLEITAMRNNGTTFTDHEVHRYLVKNKITREQGEWFRCTKKDLEAAILAIKSGIQNEDNRTLDFKLRPEQMDAVNKTAMYFNNYKKDNPKYTPHFLWNAKMRFGKTFASYQLARKMGWKKILVLTFKPAVQSAWHEDLISHVDFTDWQFVSRESLKIGKPDKKKPFVCFGSFQDYLGKNEVGGIKAKNEWVHETNWDCVILDEYHYGSWRDSAKDLFENEDKEEKYQQSGGLEYFDEKLMPITTNHYLYLSGTPFRAIDSGEFIEEQIFNWTYSDEQRAKENCKKDNNPYAALPRMVLLTYQLPDSIREIALKGEYNEFDLNIFFSAEGDMENAKFKYENEVQKWLDLIRGSFLETTIDNLKLGAKKPPMPFSDSRLLNLLSHTFWFLPSVASCHAMNLLMKKKQNKFYHDYKIIVAAGSQAGIGVEALPPVFRAMDNPLKTKTITLSCGKLTTGVTVSPWSGIFMLRNSSSPETYFQAAFRVQSPWAIKNPDSVSPNKEEIIKQECYVFDFAPDRALRQIADYSCRLNLKENDPEKKVAEFIHFLPILCYDGSSMKEMDAAGVLDIAMSGTTATLLARRWESALLVNVDNDTLQRLMNNEKAMEALMNIEGFRSLNQEIETIINKSEAIKKAKQEANKRQLTKKEKEQLTDDEKKYKSLRKQIQEKLIKFATRVPVFMYLTDHRERTLKDVITQLEPALFKKVTGLVVKDFELLVSLGVFNSGLMNDAVFKFKRYEDASLVYTGINRHNESIIGGYDTTISRDEYENYIVNEP